MNEDLPGVIPDFRHLNNGWQIPSEGYCDQPYVVKTDDDMDDAMDTESERQRGNPWKKSQQKKKKGTASTLNASVSSKSKGKNISSNNNNEHVKYMPNLSINGAARQVEEITGQMIGQISGQIIGQIIGQYLAKRLGK